MHSSILFSLLSFHLSRGVVEFMRIDIGLCNSLTGCVTLKDGLISLSQEFLSCPIILEGPIQVPPRMSALVTCSPVFPNPWHLS